VARTKSFRTQPIHEHTTNYSQNSFPTTQQQPSTSKNTNFPVTKRLRPSVIEQTKISIYELRFQDAHEYEELQPNFYEQQYYQYCGLINEGQQQIPFNTNEQNQNSSEPNENFR